MNTTSRYLRKFHTLYTTTGNGRYAANKSPIKRPNTNITNVNIIKKANANVHITAIKALLINDLFSFNPYALFIPLITALNADDADQITNSKDAPNNFNNHIINKFKCTSRQHSS